MDYGLGDYVDGDDVMRLCDSGKSRMMSCIHVDPEILRKMAIFFAPKSPSSKNKTPTPFASTLDGGFERS